MVGTQASKLCAPAATGKDDMTKDQSKSPASQKDQRQQRLAEALRANLRRRKAQSRGRKSAADDARSEDKGKNQHG